MSVSEIFQASVAEALSQGDSGSDYSVDCFVTSEVGYNDLLARVRSAPRPGSAYVGVGPCQNFTYLGVFRPEVAVIIDARVDNTIEHLIFKLCFEKSETPLEYLCRLTSRTPPRGASGSDPARVVEFFDKADGSVFEQNRVALLGELTERFRLSDKLLGRADRILNEFHTRGLEITSVSETCLANLDHIPTLREVITATSYHDNNFHHLTSQDRYDAVRDMQLRDAVIPVGGNITNSAAIDDANQILAATGCKVSAVYLSNMEEFLVQRYIISADRITSRPNPHGELTSQWRPAYDRLCSCLQKLDTSDDCLLIRFYFPGSHEGLEYGVFPWLEGHATRLAPFLSRYYAEQPASVFETYA